MSINSPQITTLIPTYKRNEFLRRAIRGALGQSYSNTIVRVFDNDPDNSLPQDLQELIKKEPRLIYQRNKTNLGHIKNFKQCFDSVETPYFSIQSDDDFLLPNFYTDALKIFKEHTNIGFVVLESLIVNQYDELITHGKGDGTINIHTTHRPTEVSEIPYLWTSILFKTELAKLFSEAVTFPHDIGSDMRCLMRAMSRYDFVVHRKPAACFTAHNGSGTASRATIEEGTAYYITQLSRYVDVIKDPQVCQEQKSFHASLLRRYRKKNLYLIWVGTILTEIAREWLDIDEFNYAPRLDRNLSALTEYEGGGVVGEILVRLRRSIFLKYLFRNCLRKYFLCRRRAWRLQMAALEHSKYQNELSILRTSK
jgi:glycosyltransferase involved in cell wall biosynthesis